MTNEAGHLLLVIHTASFSEACVQLFLLMFKIGYFFYII